MASSDRINDLIDLANESTYDDQNDFGYNSAVSFEQINLENLTFSYVKGTPVFSSLTYEIKKGDKIAIVGPSGCGKTSFSRLLLSFVTPDTGTINLINQQGQIIPQALKHGSTLRMFPKKTFSFLAQSRKIYRC